MRRLLLVVLTLLSVSAFSAPKIKFGIAVNILKTKVNYLGNDEFEINLSINQEAFDKDVDSVVLTNRVEDSEFKRITVHSNPDGTSFIFKGEGGSDFAYLYADVLFSDGESKKYMTKFSYASANRNHPGNVYSDYMKTSVEVLEISDKLVKKVHGKKVKYYDVLVELSYKTTPEEMKRFTAIKFVDGEELVSNDPVTLSELVNEKKVIIGVKYSQRIICNTWGCAIDFSSLPMKETNKCLIKGFKKTRKYYVEKSLSDSRMTTIGHRNGNKAEVIIHRYLVKENDILKSIKKAL